MKKSRSGKGSMGSIVEMVCEDEIYTEEHEKMLGSCETHWTLFVDGCGSNGRRIYDQIKGMTCHQCRLGFRFLKSLIGDFFYRS